MNPGFEALFADAGGRREAFILNVDEVQTRREKVEINREVFDTRLGKADPLVRFILDHVSRRLVQLTDKIVSDRK